MNQLFSFQSEGVPVKVLMFVFLLTGCGAASNINQMWGKDKDSVDTLMQDAQLAFDRKDFDKAEENALKVLQKNPKIGDAAALLGFVSLAKAGLHPFTVADKMVRQNSNKDDDPDKARCGTPSTKSASDVMKNLSCRLLNLTDADYDLLGKAEEFGAIVGDTKVFVPNRVTDSLRTSIKALDAVTKGIKYICPYVDRDVLSASDDRHSSTACAPVSGSSIKRTKVHFLFALLHLVEGVVYQSSLLADNVGSSKAVSLQTASKSFKDANVSASNVSAFATTIDRFKSVTETVFLTTSSPISQLQQLLIDLKTITKSFEKIPGLPAKFTKKIDEAAAELNKLGTDIGGSDGELQALKAQLSKKIAGDLSDKINSYATTAGSNLSDAQKTQICASYNSIATGTGATKPSICP